MITLISIILILACTVLDLNTLFSIVEYECEGEIVDNPYISSINYYDDGLD